MPLQFKYLVDSLTSSPTNVPRFAVDAIMLYILYRFLQGGNGLIGNLQSFLWIPVSQYTSRKVFMKAITDFSPDAPALAFSLPRVSLEEKDGRSAANYGSRSEFGRFFVAVPAL